MNPFSFFDRKVCLTLGTEEWELAKVEFARVGIEAQKFLALPADGPHESFNKSTRQILSDFLESDSETLLFLEDDCVFRDYEHLGQALRELPDDWDIVYLGANLINGTPERHSGHLFRVYSAWTTHAIGYNRKVIPYLLDNQPHVTAEMFDNWVSSQLPFLKAFVVAPMVAYQRFHTSAIWGTTEDYTPHFEASDARLI